MTIQRGDRDSATWNLITLFATIGPGCACPDIKRPTLVGIRATAVGHDAIHGHGTGVDAV
jgi:hypothetical protein